MDILDRETLRSMFASKPTETAEIDELPDSTIPIMRLSELDLSELNKPNWTFGYGESAEPAKHDGEIIDKKYHVMNKIGAGGASEVYLCERLMVGDQVAIKILRNTYAKDPEPAQRFHLEALTTASIKHPNVLTIHDFDFTEDGTPFIVMELIRGQTLLGEIRRSGSIALRRAVQLITPICSALNVAHRQGIIHRDLKPANIVINHMDDDSEVVKLIDFGIAKKYSSELNSKQDLKSELLNTLPGKLVGTPAYMAPERCLEEKYDNRTDIYNLGLILYEMLTGHHPFFGAKTITAMMAMQISKDPPSLTDLVPDVNREVEIVIFKALAKSPNDRYATALEFADDLNNAFYAPWL
jgi:eukaryotic-like serine/threonine-protein kinase